MSNSKSPDYIGYVVRETKSGQYWTRIAAAWKHQNSGGFTVQLSAAPLDGKLVFLPPKLKPDGQEDPMPGA